MNGSTTHVQDAHEGRLQEMESIVAEYETPLLRYATRIVNNPFSAQDVVQNVFIKLFKAWKEDTRPTDKLKGWLFRVTHNEAVDFIRKESRLKNLHERHVEEETAACPDGHNCPAPMDDRLQRVMAHVHQLHPREQQVLVLRLEEGLSYREISEITGRSVGNVGNILHHAVRKLSEKLKQEEII